MGNHDPKALKSEASKTRGDMNFASLHHHTTFSTLDGYGTPEEHAEEMAERGATTMAVTEHGNVSSHVRFEQAADRFGIKPIFGCELYTGHVDEDKRGQRKNHLTVLAEDDEGYKNLLRVVSKGWAEGYYYEPTVSGEMLREHKSGLIVLSGCAGSLLATSLIGGKNVPIEEASLRRARSVAKRFHSILGDQYYIEVQAFPDLDKTCKINEGLGQIADELGIPLVATLDVHYTDPDDSEMQQILHSIRGGGRKRSTEEDKAKGWSYDVKLTVPHASPAQKKRAKGNLADRAIFEALVRTGLTRRQASEAIYNAKEIGQRCNVRLPKMNVLRYPLPSGMTDPVSLFRRWCEEGWKFRGIDSREDVQKYKARVKREMKLIEEKGFVDYFLVVADATKFAKDAGIPVGPARGSAAASLVCYLLRITEIDPMPFPTLLFERFIDANRHDLPDIDLDFDDERRHEVYDYLVAKYGADRVGNIANFAMFRGKNSLDDVARVHDIPMWEVDKLKDLIIERSSGDLRANSTIEDTVEQFEEARRIVEQYPELLLATKLEGNLRNLSVHAAGLVVADAPLTDACAVYTKVDNTTGMPKLDEDGNPMQVISLDKYDAEYLNVMKLDILGLKTMGMVRIALEAIGMSLMELYDLPLDDEDTIRGFRDGDVVGVFQFDGRAMRSVNSGVVPDNFMEICDINALARPGPLHSGATAEYIDAKHGRKEPVSYHPIVDRITEHTHGQVVYQEQILQVVRELGKFTWEEAARIRKIISKKRGEQEFNTMRAKFITGSAEEGMSPEDADKVFSMLATAGAYAFNAAHCVSYGMLAYWTMWMKVHHPVAFFTAALRKCPTDAKGKDRLQQLLRDAAKRDIEILPPDLNKSERSWSIDGDSIRAGFVQVNGIGDATATAILDYREECGGLDSWDQLLKVKGIGEKTIALVQEFVEDPDPFNLNLLRDKLQEVREAILSGELGDLPHPTHTSIEVPYDRAPYNTEVVWLGVLRERNLKDLFELHHSRTGEHLDPATVKNPELNEWVVFMGEDDTEPIVVTINRWRYRKFKEAAFSVKLDHDLVLVRGLKYGIQSRRAIYVTDMWVIDPEDD